MAESKQFGMFWGYEALYFVETEGVIPKKIFHIPLEKKDSANIKRDAADPKRSKLVFTIKGVLNKYKISNGSINLSLPIRDIIFRSFVIPSMQPHEIRSVVEFEISKYIPFSLEELSFAFHPITIEQENLKLIRIIFVAIKNDALETYTNILEAASLSVHIVEPAALSLIRALRFKEQIPQNETIALIEKENIGRITIADNETPQFVREFHLSAMAGEDMTQDLDSDVKKLGKEARISLDYFNRQNQQLQVKRIFLLALSQQQEVIKHLEGLLNLPVTAINNHAIINETPKIGLGILNAFGACLLTSKGTTISFNLMKKKAKYIQPMEAPVKRPVTIKSIIVTVLVCVPVIVASILLSSITIQEYNQKISNLHEKLGLFQDAELSVIQQQSGDLQAKLDYLTNTITKSDIASLLTLIPDLLPEGTWIDNLNIKFDDSKFINSAKTEEAQTSNTPPSSNKIDINPTLTITIDGYAFSFDKNLQFRLVNILLGALKDSREFSLFFENIDLQTTNIEKIDDQDVTFFKIVCLHKYELTESK
jgi:hypothetical protein